MKASPIESTVRVIVWASLGLAFVSWLGCEQTTTNAFATCAADGAPRFGACDSGSADASPDAATDGPPQDAPVADGPAEDPDSRPDPAAEPADDPPAPDADAADPTDPEADDDVPPGDPDADPDVSEPPCPADMVLVDAVCMDRYEAPNHPGAVPLVMYHYYEAEDWCEARGKRLCYDDEWLLACQGHAGTTYPYGDVHQPGVCNDEEIWRVYDQTLLNGWSSAGSTPDHESFQEQLDAARAVGSVAAAAADHVEDLYQGEGGGDNDGCGGEFGVFDLVGNAEEWTIRRDGGDGPDFSGNLKGRYWAESRTCQSNVRGHGNAFRFYEIGFRCCRDPGD